MTEQEIRQMQLSLLRPAIARLRASVMGIVLGLLLGGGLFTATVWLVIQGGPLVGLHLSLLNNYYPGYSVTWGGAFVGLFYGMVTGGVIGYVTTYLYNTIAFRKREGS